MRIPLRTLFPTALGALLAALVPVQAFAFEIPTGWSSVACSVLPCSGAGGGAGGLSDYILDKGTAALQIVFIAAAILILFLQAANMVIFADQEDVVKQGRSAFIYAIAGCAVVSLAGMIAKAFAPLETGSELVNVAPFNEGVGNVITYFKLALGIAFVANTVIQGIRLVASQGEQDKVDKARKHMIFGFVGVGFILLANTIAIAINPGAAGSQTLAKEIAGIASYMITIIGFGAVIVIIVAGVMLIVSVDESFKDKAKTAVRTAIIALIAVLVSYALVTAFIDVGSAVAT